MAIAPVKRSLVADGGWGGSAADFGLQRGRLCGDAGGVGWGAAVAGEIEGCFGGWGLMRSRFLGVGGAGYS